MLTPLSDFDSSLIASASLIMLAPLRIGEKSWVIVELDELRRPGGLKIVVVDCLTGSALFFDSLDDFLAFIINYNNLIISDMDDIDALALLKEEMETEEIHLKVNAIHRLKTVILCVGVDETIKKVIPYLESLIEKEDDEVLFAIAEELGKVW